MDVCHPEEPRPKNRRHEGGLSSNRALAILRGLKQLNLVGMDIVEVAPAYDTSQVTALAAATLGLEFLYLLASQCE